MPGNQFGTARDWLAPILTGPGSNVSCPAATWTVVSNTGTLYIATPGDYFPVAIGVLSILFGGTLPSALYFGLQVTSGSVLSATYMDLTSVVASSHVNFPFVLIGANSNAQWQAGTNTLNVGVYPTGQAVTCVGTYGNILYLLLPGPTA